MEHKNLFDIHCHFPVDDNISHTFIASGFSKDSNNKIMDEILIFEQGYFTLGLAPQEIQRNELYPNIDMAIEDIQKQIEEAFSNPSLAKKFVGIGEVGLDKHWGKTSEHRERQFFAFEKMISLANARTLPLIIHSRKAEKECMQQLSAANCKKVLMHCFGGNLTQAKKAADLGWLISIPPLPSKNRKKIIEKIPIENFVIESDAPYIGKKSEDAFNSAKMISEIKNIPVEEAIDATNENARKFFNI
ncbi:MAG: TatD family hydrolase [Candidatus Micrarchaeota archaeon]